MTGRCKDAGLKIMLSTTQVGKTQLASSSTRSRARYIKLMEQSLEQILDAMGSRFGKGSFQIIAKRADTDAQG